jgi:hypothetical protein
MSEGQAIERGLSRRARPAPGDAQEHARQIQNRLGRERAREQLGVSDRTYRRWLAGGRPSAANAEQLAKHASISPRREARMRKRGAYLRAAGMVGGTPGGRRSNWRHRTIGGRGQASVYLTGDEMGKILDRYYAGDTKGAYDVLTDALAENGFGALKIEDPTRLEFLQRDPNEPGRGGEGT